MKQKSLVAISIACGVVCALCVALFMASVQGEAETARAEALARYGGEQVEVCVASRNIVAGERVDLSAVETKLWVADLLPEGAVRATSDAVGKTATSSIFKGEVIVAGRFDAGHDSLDVPSGKQAVSVPAKAVQAVGGAIRPGMSVDIYSSGESSTVALAQNVNVLDTSVGNSGSLVSGGSGWVTLAVEPEKVQELIAASNKTTLYFTLPGASVEGGGADQDDSTEGASAQAASVEGGSGQAASSGAAASAAAASATAAKRDSSKSSEAKNSPVSASSASDSAAATPPEKADGSQEAPRSQEAPQSQEPPHSQESSNSAGGDR